MIAKRHTSENMNDTEEQLKKAEDLILALVESTPNSVWLCCHDEAVTWLEDRNEYKRKQTYEHTNST